MEIMQWFLIAVLGLFFGLQLLAKFLPRPEHKSWKDVWKDFF